MYCQTNLFADSLRNYATNLASLNGFEMSINLNGLLTEQMTPSQIEKARELARECVAKNYKGC